MSGYHACSHLLGCREIFEGERGTTMPQERKTHRSNHGTRNSMDSLRCASVSSPSLRPQSNEASHSHDPGEGSRGKGRQRPTKPRTFSVACLYLRRSPWSPNIVYQMCSRGVWQLERMTLRYCRHSGSSDGARCVGDVVEDALPLPEIVQCSSGLHHVAWSRCREFIRSRLVNFAEKNPQLSIAAKQAPGKHPKLVGEYGAATREFTRAPGAQAALLSNVSCVDCIAVVQ